MLHLVWSVDYALLMLTWLLVSVIVGWLLCEREWLDVGGRRMLENHRRWLAEQAELATYGRYSH